MEYVYRFRSMDALLGERGELEKQEIFFASRKQLNDPVEGYKDLFWKGDVIAWKNFLRHYVLCLMQTILQALENKEGHVVTPENLPIRMIPEELHPEVASIFHAICAKMLADPELSELPGLLEARVSPIRRNELLSVLFPVHFRLFTLICTSLQPDAPFHPIDAFFRERGARPLRLKESFAALNEWDTTNPGNPDIVEAMTAKSISAIEQTTFLRDYTGISQQHGPVWRVIGSTFPDVYLLSLEYLSFGDWYTACFVASPSHASMWGYYGDGHRGACLKFKTTTLPEGEPALRLNRQIGIGGPPHAPERIFAYSPQPLQQVHYANRYPEVDFFRSLGTLVPAQAAFWFRGEDGTMSATGKDLVLQTEEWRKQYWATFHAGVTNKLTDWQHEQEYRITLQSSLVDLSSPAERTLKYLFEDLQGILFGMNMSAEDRAAIVRIIAAKCAETGRTDFEFYQAYYSRLTGKVEAALWDLVKFHPAESAPLSPPKAAS
jgi:hypothetical protein